MNFIDYFDGDRVTVRGSKGLMWGENTTMLYSEDVAIDLHVNLTDKPTLSLFLTASTDLEDDVIPGQEILEEFIVENDGNIAGDVSITKDLL